MVQQTSRSDERKGSRGRPRDLAIDRAIIEATRAVVAERGFEGATVNDVALRAGIPKSSLYRRFESREQLLLVVGRDAIAQRREVPDTGSLRGDLVALVNLLVRAIEKRHNIVQVAVAAVNDPGLQPVVGDLYQEMVSRTTEILDRADARGELTADVDATRVMEMVAGQVLARFLGRQTVDLSSAEQGVDLLLRGIATNP